LREKVIQMDRDTVAINCRKRMRMSEDEKYRGEARMLKEESKAI
jgi:hypothetical protein